ncbi:hypothetical protein M8C21_031776 [Ambrosia artemisiifolia]|uniref:Uncharacterized protein n=1 Tax=Ambrosia artemisiifolia TaxID=4212 RepID=A0AAD5BMG7_AMBAR|nr:hypothetical protein M8C21_031776 [Ambrosia artemisiifolia]
MVRKKLELKRIENKSSRLVTFSKRRTGLIKKARQLSLLCGVDVAVIVINARGKLYESCSGTTNSVDRIISRYKKSCLKAGEMTTEASKDLELLLECNRSFRTCKDLLHTVDRLTEENNAEELSVNDMTELEQEIDAALMQTRLRKTQLMMGYISNLKEKENKLSEEKEELKKQVATAEGNDVDDGGGGLNSLAANQISSPQLITLPLFKD